MVDLSLIRCEHCMIYAVWCVKMRYSGVKSVVSNRNIGSNNVPIETNRSKKRENSDSELFVPQKIRWGSLGIPKKVPGRAPLHLRSESRSPWYRLRGRS